MAVHLLPLEKIRNGEARKPGTVVHQQHQKKPPYINFTALFDFEIEGARFCQVHQRHEIKDDNRYGNSHQVATVLQGAFGEALKLCNSISVGHGGITRLDCVAVKR